MSAATARDDLVAQCLRLRRASLGLLARQTTAAQFAVEVNGTTDGAWRTFLFADVAALTLADALGDEVRRLSCDRHTALREFADRSVQRILAARSQLAAIDALAAKYDLHPVLLKGAVHVAAGRIAFDLGDVDVLLDAAEFRAFVRAMTTAGYRDVSGVGMLESPGFLSVDAHDVLHLGTDVPFAANFDTEAMPGFTRLRRLCNVPHIVHLVQHGTTGHAHRRSLVRDVALMADAIRRCTAGELADIHALLAATADSRANLDTLALVTACARSEPVVELARPYEVLACNNYDLASRPTSAIDRLFPATETTVAFYAGGMSDVARLTRWLLCSPIFAGSHWHWRWLARRAPRLARISGYVARTPYRVVLVCYLAAKALRVRWRYARTWRPRAAAITAPRP